LVTEFDTTLISDASKINYLPVPNFIEYKSGNKLKFNSFLPKGFSIFVLESQNIKKFAKYDLSFNPQMPSNWKNGYSKGIAINEKEGTVIYWGIIW
jgi:hypothetical protein